MEILMNFDKEKIYKMLAVLAAIVVVAGGMTRLARRNSMSLTEFMEQNSSAGSTVPSSPEPASATPDTDSSPAPASLLTGANLNGDSMLSQRVTYTKGFYYEPLSDDLKNYMAGVPLEELRYVHVWHYDFTGSPVEGELICNEYIAQDLLEIFYELYRNEYQLESVLLVEEYDGEHVSSMEANNTCCFSYDTEEGDAGLSKHAYGLAVDVNPLYNPHVSYEKDGTEIISPSSAVEYADRSKSFSYKIDADDLCCKLFLQHGFIWGGNRNDSKNYMHFQKSTPPPQAEER